MTLDEARAKFPGLGFAVYAYEPGKPVTLEIHNTDGETFTFIGPTEQAALDEAFPPEPDETPEPAESLFD